jgi:hypothetical protein
MAIKVAEMDFDAARRLISYIFAWKGVDSNEMGQYDEAIDGFRWLYGADYNINTSFVKGSRTVNNNIRNSSREIFRGARLHAKAALSDLLMHSQRFADIFFNIASDIDCTLKDVRFFPSTCLREAPISQTPMFETSRQIRLFDSIQTIFDRTTGAIEKSADDLDLNSIHDLLISILELATLNDACSLSLTWKKYPWEVDIYEDQNAKFLIAAACFDEAVQRCQTALRADEEVALSNALIKLRDISNGIQKFLDRISNDAQTVFLDPKLNWPEFPEDYKYPIYWIGGA